jgi:hypothetical protein
LAVCKAQVWVRLTAMESGSRNICLQSCELF